MWFKLVVLFGLSAVVAQCAPVNLDKVKKLLNDPKYFDYYQQHGLKPGDDEIDGFPHYIKDTIKNFRNWQPKLQDTSSPEYQELLAAQNGTRQIPTDENELFDQYLQTLYNADKKFVTTTTSAPSTTNSTTTLPPSTSSSTTTPSVSSTSATSTTPVVPSSTDLESKFGNLDKQFQPVNTFSKETPPQTSTQQPAITSTTNLPSSTSTTTLAPPAISSTTTPTASSTSAPSTNPDVSTPTDLESELNNLDKQFQPINTAYPETSSQISSQQGVTTSTTTSQPSITTSTTTSAPSITTSTITSAKSTTTSSTPPAPSTTPSTTPPAPSTTTSITTSASSTTTTHQPVITSTSTLPSPSSTHPAVSSPAPVPSVNGNKQNENVANPLQIPVNPQTPREINNQQIPTQKLSFSDEDLDLLDQIDTKHYPKPRPRTVAERVKEQKGASLQAADANYSFGFNVDDNIEGGSQQRIERMKNGKVYGKYSYDDGFSYVTRYYVADGNGFRIIKQYSIPSVKENTPLTGDASVQYSGDNMPANYRIKDVKSYNGKKPNH